MPSAALTDCISRVLTSQLQGVLATQHDAKPYTSLMAFAHTPDLRHLILATFRDTQKHCNLLANAWVSFLVDDRSNDPIDYQHAVAISVCGRAVMLDEHERVNFLPIYLGKHPQLHEFASSPNCALLRIDVEEYRVISRFQSVEILSISHSDGAGSA